jgi:hypothetical protein
MNKLRILQCAVIALTLSACSSQTPSSDQAGPADVAPERGSKTSAPPPAVAKAPAPVANSAVTGDTPITKENYAQVMEARSREYEQAEWKKISLEGYSCGDNCYVEYSPHIEGGGDMTALCSAKICGDWERAGKLPAEFRGKTAEVKYGTAPRIDGSGNKVDTYRNIIDIRFPK